jgi:hypothetical protein
METHEFGSLAQEQDAHVFTGDKSMFPSHRHFARPVTRLASALAIAAFTPVAVTEAAGIPIRSTSTVSAPSGPELQALILRDCRDIDYGRVDGFEGMLSDFVCGS